MSHCYWRANENHEDEAAEPGGCLSLTRDQQQPQVRRTEAL